MYLKKGLILYWPFQFDILQTFFMQGSKHASQPILSYNCTGPPSIRYLTKNYHLMTNSPKGRPRSKKVCHELKTPTYKLIYSNHLPYDLALGVY